MEPDADDEDPIDLQMLKDKEQEVLGHTDTDIGFGKITRYLPMAHPDEPNLIAYRVVRTPVKGGIDFDQVTPDEELTLEAEPLPHPIVWDSYDFDISFAPRPYAMIQDDLIELVERQWFREDGEQRTYRYATEWYRYTEFMTEPRGEFVKAKVGQMKFRTAVGSDVPNGTPYPAVQSMPLPDDTLIVRWYRVPYRYIRSSNSYLRRFRNYINQFEWENYPIGAIRYQGFKERRFTPPIAELDPEWGGLGVFSTEKLCDIDLTFHITRRTLASEPATDPTTINGNWMKAGHNLLPHFLTRKFYYASADTATAALQFPTFQSFPLEILFTDPDAVQPDGAFL